MSREFRLAPFPNLPSPVTRDSIRQYLDRVLPVDWDVTHVRWEGSGSLSVTHCPVRIVVVKPETFSEMSSPDVFAGHDAPMSAETIQNSVAVRCTPVLSTGHPEGVQSHRKKNPERFSHHCITAKLPGNKQEVVLNEAETNDSLTEQDLLMGVVNAVNRFEATGHAAPSDSPASSQATDSVDEAQAQLPLQSDD